MATQSVSPKPCPSQSSSISTTSQETPHKGKKIMGTTEKVMMKENLEEGQEKIKPRLDINLLFNQNINTDNSASETEVELKLFSLGNSSQANESCSSEKIIPIKQLKQKEFTCSFCSNSYFSAQALGGHQKVHKKERAFAKRREEMDTWALGHFHHFPYHHLYSTIPQIPNNFYGSFNRPSPLGVNLQSVSIHKPSYNPLIPLRKGKTMMSARLAYDQLSLERVFQAQNTTSSLSSTGSTIAANSRPTNVDDNNYLKGKNDPLQSNDHQDDSGLDLSLKL